jgi:CRISPR-associated endonuclease/helicase Cas3
MSHENSAQAWFQMLTGHESAHPWQQELMGQETCRSQLVQIPTGLGKTEGILATWSFHRVRNSDDRWPRRLVWCLPMRVLVEQTEQVARAMVARMPAEIRPDVYLAMGGADSGEWLLYPERPAILVGTQDMLLSRALNRGYGSGRARWPVEFGLLSQDALWVMDEVQLMDVGLATSAQLQAYRDDDARKSIRPCHTWWMSATLQPEWLHSVDTKTHCPQWTQGPCETTPEQRTGPLWDGKKQLEPATINSDSEYFAGFAAKIKEEHGRAEAGEQGRITLVVCNTVDRALGTYKALRASGTENIELIHSRFRPAEREGWRNRFLSKEACIAGADRIIVSTQVVEAGVDISAVALVTELAPWSSLVQRFGRCARFGGNGRVTVVDRGHEEGKTAPYEAEDLEQAWNELSKLTDVGVASLEAHEAGLTPEERAQLYPYAPKHLLMRQEFDELFDTTPDLSGGDIDVSRFIRSGDERDVAVFWRDMPKDEIPGEKVQPSRRELCAVPFLKSRDWLCGEETKTNRKAKLRKAMRAWVWDWLAGEWTKADRASLTPGRIVCVASECGGYLQEVGFEAISTAGVPEAQSPPLATETVLLDDSDNQQDVEGLSVHEWKTIATHGMEVSSEAGAIAEAVGLTAELRGSLTIAGQWHDVGKSHGAFQGAIRHRNRPARNDLAKAPNGAWLLPPGTYRFADNRDARPAFRHELASALALFAVLDRYAPKHEALLGPWVDVLSRMGSVIREGQEIPPGCPEVNQLLECNAAMFNLVAYLVASHHGKVRVTLHAAPGDQDYRDRDGRGMPIRGTREGDRLPSISTGQGTCLPELDLTLEPAAMGLSARTGVSWRERVAGLLTRYGPGALGYLEALIRAADVRASRLETADPVLAEEAGS